MIRPSKQDFLKIAAADNVVAVMLELGADRFTPIDAYYALGASYLLESAERGSTVGRYSFLGIEPVLRLSIDGCVCTITEDGKQRTTQSNDPLRLVGEILSERSYIGNGDLSPFPGGAVGYVGYDMVSQWEKLPDASAKPTTGIPDAVFMMTKYHLVFDNLMHNVKIIANVRTGSDLSGDYDAAIVGIEAISQKLKDAAKNPVVSGSVKISELVPQMDRAVYEKGVADTKELIASGECIQVVISQRFSADIEGDSFEVFRALRSINPSPYMFYLDFDDFVLLGASPEVMVKVDNGKAMLRPIAGTRPRGKTPLEDEALKAELLADEKERAEHIMLIDLARNDLGRIAQSGSVTVDRYMEVESYSHVMHIVSEVSAKLRPETDVFDVIRATFPAGTVSGAPKVRAMEIISDFEPVKRGAYAGLVGYFSLNGGFDSCITIRSALVKDGKIHLQAGAGIVFDSVPEKEYDETINKTGALIKALRKAEEQK